jgi:hypothetical protein
MDKTLDEQLKRLGGQFAIGRMDHVEKENVYAEYGELYRKIGPQRFTAAVDVCIRCHKGGFLPRPSEFRSYIDGDVDRAAETDCPFCGDTSGFVYETEFRNGMEYEVARRCRH